MTAPGFDSSSDATVSPQRTSHMDCLRRWLRVLRRKGTRALWNISTTLSPCGVIHLNRGSLDADQGVDLIASQARDLRRRFVLCTGSFMGRKPFVVASCGGGGASGGAALQSVQAPSLPIYVPGTTLNATDSSGNTWSATYSSIAVGTSTFNGQVAYDTAIFSRCQAEPLW